MAVTKHNVRMSIAMGMFDSLYIELDGREQEIQTKRFDCMLGSRAQWNRKGS